MIGYKVLVRKTSNLSAGPERIFRSNDREDAERVYQQFIIDANNGETIELYSTNKIIKEHHK